MLRRKFILPFVLTAALLMLAAACQPAGNEPGAPVEEVEATEPPAPTATPEKEVEPESQYPDAVDAARQQLASDLGVEADAITVASFEAREWPDACLGLPKEGQMCAEVITPGYLVILNAEGQSHRARTNEDGSVIIFEDKGGEQSGLPEAVVAARQALAEKLGVSADEIEVISYEEREWTDSCLGLGGAAESCLQVITPGWLVTLGADGQVYEFHTDQTGNAVRAADPLGNKRGAGLPEPIVTFERSGGFAGDVVKYFIYPDGQVEKRTGLPERSQPIELLAMAPEEVGPFVQDLKNLGFVELAGDYVPKNTCCDRFLYIVTLRVQDEIYTIHALDDAEGTPQGVWEIIDTVEQFIQNVSNTG